MTVNQTSLISRCSETGQGPHLQLVDLSVVAKSKILLSLDESW